MKISNESRFWWQGFENGLTCAKRAFLLLICFVYTQLTGLVRSLWKCFTAFQFSFESISELSNVEENNESYEESEPPFLRYKKLYFRDSMSRKLHWSEQMCTKKISKKPKEICAKSKSMQGKDIILNDEMKKNISFSIKSIEAKIAASNTVMQILKTEKCRQLESLNQLLRQYTGRGKPFKGSASGTFKTGFSGICSIDSLINLLRSSEIKSSEKHELCSHTKRCPLCIVRSSIFRIEKNKDNKSYVKIPEIQKNLDIFLGKEYCGSCYKPLKNESEPKSHSCPLMKPADIALKDVLDNFLKQENLTQHFVMNLTCQGCLQSISPFSEGYFKVEKNRNEKSSELSFRIDDMLQSIKRYHWEHAPKCNNSRFNMEKMPNNFLIMMEP